MMILNIKAMENLLNPQDCWGIKIEFLVWQCFLPRRSPGFGLQWVYRSVLRSVHVGEWTHVKELLCSLEESWLHFSGG